MDAINVVETGGNMAQKGHYRMKREWLDKIYRTENDSPPPSPRPTKTIRTRKLPQVKNYLGL